MAGYKDLAASRLAVAQQKWPRDFVRPRPAIAYPDKTQEQLYSKPPHFQILLKAPLKMGPRRLPAQRRARRPGSLRYNCVLCSIRRLHCHPDSSGVPAGRATARGAAIGAPTGRHPARHPHRSAVCESLVGASCPNARQCGSHPPPIPCALDPSIPKGRRSKMIGSMVGQVLRHFDRRSGFASSVKNRATSVPDQVRRWCSH